MNAAHEVREYWELQGLTQIPIILNTQMPATPRAVPNTHVSAMHAVKDAPISKSRKRSIRKRLISLFLADVDLDQQAYSSTVHVIRGSAL